MALANFGRRDAGWWGSDSGCPWWTRSAKDPRFNMSGHASGAWDAMDKANKAILVKESELGCQAPDDLEYGGMKP